ncbi:MAG: NACHT domain-containing protein [Phycisphaerales bacterium]
MARTFSERDIELLGYTKPVLEHNRDGYAVYSAEAIAGLDVVPANFVYLKSSVTNDGAQDAARFLNNAQNFVVVPRNLEPRIPHLKSMFRSAAKLYVHEDIVWDSIRRTFAEYLYALEHSLPEVSFYVTPRPEREPKESLDGVAIAWLTRAGDSSGARIMAVLAAAGIGKTTLSREVARQLARRADHNRIIPVYVEASHWARMQLDSFEDLWALIGNSLRHFCPTLQVTRTVFEHLLRAGDLAFVFDGFDELCGRRSDVFNARETLHELVSLAEQSAGRIMLTSRTLYWESEIGEQKLPVITEHLAPFTKPQAMQYLEKRFETRREVRERARNLLDSVRDRNHPDTPGGGKKQISYHPFLIDLVSTAAELGVAAMESQESGPLYGILSSFCERERHRQNLRTTAITQLTALELLAVEGGSEFSVEDCLIAGFAETDSDQLKLHPLLDLTPSGAKLHFRYDFIPVFLRARFVAREIAACSASRRVSDRAVAWMIKEAAGSSYFIDHSCDCWLEAPLDQLGVVFRQLLRPQERAKSYLFHLTKALTNLRHGNLSKHERALEVMNILFGRGRRVPSKLDGLYLTGTVEKFDFGGFIFSNCVFEDLVFSDCDVDGDTVFDGCRFPGTMEIVGSNRSGWSEVRLTENCDIGAKARIAFAIVGLGGGAGAEELASQCLELALTKFWKGGHIHRSVARVHWARGPLGQHPLRERVLRALIRQGVIREIQIGGVAEGGLALEKDAEPDLQRFMDNRQLTGRIKRALEELSLA